MGDINLVDQESFDDHNDRHEDGGADELDVDGLSGVLADQQDPQSHGNDRHTENFIPDTEIGAEDGVASLGSDGKLVDGQVPSLAITDVSVVDSESDLTTLTDAEIGDVGIVQAADPEDNNAFILTGTDPTDLDNWVEIQTPQSPVQSVNNQTGDVTLDNDDVGAPSQSEFDNHSARHENDGADEIDVSGLSGVLADQQDPQSHGNERHTENFTEDTHDHSGGSDGSDTLNPDTVNANEVNADDQLDAPRVATRSDFDGVGLFYIEDEDQVSFRVS